MINCLDRVLHQLYEKEFIEPDTNPSSRALKTSRMQELRVGIINLHPREHLHIKDLYPRDLGKLVSMTGMAVRLSEIYPEMKAAVFRCQGCRHEITIELLNGHVEEPSQCGRCKKKEVMELIHNSCQFTNKQYIKFQEMLQNVAQGQAPSSVTLISYDNNVDRIRPGDCVQITGIYRCYPIQAQRGKAIYRQTFGTYFDLISFEVLNNKESSMTMHNSGFTSKERKEFIKMADSTTIIDDLISSFSPSIYGNVNVKKGILTQLFGGNHHKVTDGSRLRSDINICLVGDPSTAKSQFLQQVKKIAPRSVYTCGRGSSAAGLTANVRKDP